MQKMRFRIMKKDSGKMGGKMRAKLMSEIVNEGKGREG